MEEWNCKKCGACCEILYQANFGCDCPAYDKEKKECKDYENRPEMCRTKVKIFGDKKYNEACDNLRNARR